MTTLTTIPLAAAARASALDGDLMQRVTASRNPVLIIVIAAAIIVGLGFVAYLQVQCMSHGYRAFNAVVSVQWHGAVNATVKFSCVK
ncbi:hypothetical protein [Curtobacterium sp. MCBD17_032]|uniref:hypothetical protein n=1 Tax=Curtobacterium sp. MCBD17_032 TaxID=2175659 RepID=UPI0015E89F0D|nr:hypothetical protein [Curtobacterium sp. MCBD17_032]